MATSDEKKLDKASKPPPSGNPKKKSKKKSAAEVQQDLRELSKGEDRPPVDLTKIYRNIAIVAVLVWVIAVIVSSTAKGSSVYAFAAAGVLTVVAVGGAIWLQRYVKKSAALGAILKGADTEEGRKLALERLSTEFKKDDTQALIA